MIKKFPLKKISSSNALQLHQKKKTTLRLGHSSGENRLYRNDIKIEAGGTERDFDLAEIADTIGNALTDLLLSRQEEEIFTEVNRKFVASVAESVGEVLAKQIELGRALKLSTYDIHLLIEKALIENDAHDVARSLMFSRIKSSAKDTQRTQFPLDLSVVTVK